MKEKEDRLYSEWICRRQAMQMPEGFAERVMGEIAKKTATSVERPAVYTIFSSRPMQWAAAIGALMLGLFRLSYITRAILIP
jgi:hypothetical protein